MKQIKGFYWKLITVILLLFTVIGGLLFEVPRLNILNETVRNLYFHVPMWFGMTVILGASVFYSVKYLQNPLSKYDILAVECANVGILFGILGMISGMVWAQFTWGSYWSGDPKQNAAAVGLLIYFAYSILRGLFQDESQRNRISAIYNIFAYATFIPLIFILPRLTDSLHPGNGGNPGFNAYDLDSKLRLVFYPAVIAWIMLGGWIVNVRARLRMAQQKLEDLDIYL
ncbi:cytochrome c biogenesis protein CcsA [Flexithrix dorotheae]|uniref:cytochrome c biogenesis protein CcsA n=1 Tax=Flexithrix dorotheae TaxID=70993 RepID=UPI000364C37E